VARDRRQKGRGVVVSGSASPMLGGRDRRWPARGVRATDRRRSAQEGRGGGALAGGGGGRGDDLLREAAAA
jgi:hypothetical protein